MNRDDLMISIAALIAMCGSLLIGFYLGRGNPPKARTDDVRDWAEAAWNNGFHTCQWPGVSAETISYNKKFSVDAVVEAHRGVWH